MGRFSTAFLSKVPGRNRLRNFLSRTRNFLAFYWKLEIGYFLLAAAYLSAYSWIVTHFADFIRNEVISEISLVYLTIVGIMLGMAPLIEERSLRRFLAVPLGVPTMMVSPTTFATSRFQSIQLGYSSFFPTTLLFHTAGVLFILFIETYAFGMLVPFEPKDPSQTEP